MIRQVTSFVVGFLVLTTCWIVTTHAQPACLDGPRLVGQNGGNQKFQAFNRCGGTVRVRFIFQEGEGAKPHNEVWAIERCKPGTYSYNPKYLKAGPDFEWDGGEASLTCLRKDDATKRSNEEDRPLKAKPSTAPRAAPSPSSAKTSSRPTAPLGPSGNAGSASPSSPSAQDLERKPGYSAWNKTPWPDNEIAAQCNAGRHLIRGCDIDERKFKMRQPYCENARKLVQMYCDKRA
jgi:hypothetical protein